MKKKRSPCSSSGRAFYTLSLIVICPLDDLPFVSLTFAMGQILIDYFGPGSSNRFVIRRRRTRSMPTIDPPHTATRAHKAEHSFFIFLLFIY